MYTSILHGLLTGFLFPLMPMFWFRELPLPNFFDAEAEVIDATGLESEREGRLDVQGGGASGGASRRGRLPAGLGLSTMRSSEGARNAGGDIVASSVFGKRMQVSLKRPLCPRTSGLAWCRQTGVADAVRWESCSA
jgi:hypothetical protein